MKTRLKLLCRNSKRIVAQGEVQQENWLRRLAHKFKYNTSDENCLEKTDLSVLRNSVTAMVAGTSFDSLSNEAYAKKLKYSSDLLIKAGYNKQDVEAAAAKLNQARQAVAKVGSIISVPTKDGKKTGICGSYMYTVKEVSNAYVTLINPLNISEEFQISEIYFKLIFSDVVVN